MPMAINISLFELSRLEGPSERVPAQFSSFPTSSHRTSFPNHRNTSIVVVFRRSMIDLITPSLNYTHEPTNHPSSATPTEKAVHTRFRFDPKKKRRDRSHVVAQRRRKKNLSINKLIFSESCRVSHRSRRMECCCKSRSDAQTQIAPLVSLLCNEMETQIKVSDTNVLYLARLTYSPRGSPQKAFLFALPKNYEL